MLKLGDLVRIQTEPRGYGYQERKGIRQIGTITALKEQEENQLKIKLNLNRESLYAIIDAKPEGKTYKGITSNMEETLYIYNILYPNDTIRITKITLPTFQEYPVGALVQPFYLNSCKDGTVTNRYGNISLKTGETEVFDLETGQIRIIDPKILTGSSSVELHIFLSADGDRELPDAQPKPKIIQSKTRYIYGDLKAVFINMIILHSGLQVKDCIKREDPFYLTPEKSFLCHLRDQTFYNFDQKMIQTLPATNLLVPLAVTAEGKGFQGLKLIRNGNFF